MRSLNPPFSFCWTTPSGVPSRIAEIGMCAARDHVRVARALRSLPKITVAFARGELSFSKVRARHMPCAKVRRLVSGFLHGKGRKTPSGEPSTRVIAGITVTIVDLRADGHKGRTRFSATYGLRIS